MCPVKKQRYKVKFWKWGPKTIWAQHVKGPILISQNHSTLLCITVLPKQNQFNPNRPEILLHHNQTYSTYAIFVYVISHILIRLSIIYNYKLAYWQNSTMNINNAIYIECSILFKPRTRVGHPFFSKERSDLCVLFRSL